MLSTITDNLSFLHEQIASAAEISGRSPGDVEIMAVTKTLKRETVLEAYAAGLRLFGENRVQEADEKFRKMPEDIVLHLIGHLQTNKAKIAAPLFSCVESIDSLHTASALANRLRTLDLHMDILFELNTSKESAKSGYESYEALLREIDPVLDLGRLVPRGLMTVGPLTDEPIRIRTAFRTLKTCFDDLSGRYPELKIDTLSMGMSADYKIAVEEGSTRVRIGSALFGQRGI